MPTYFRPIGAEMVTQTYSHVLLPDRLSVAMFQAARDVYCRAADEDYAVARHCWKNSWMRQVLWSANQAVEKYLKSAFLINGLSAKFKHQWLDKYKEISDLSSKRGYLLTEVLLSPNECVSDWAAMLGVDYEEPTADFIDRLHEAGSSAVRYNEFSWVDLGYFDLHKLDTIIRWLRGLSVPLEGRLLEDSSQGANPDPALYEFQRSVQRYSTLNLANFAFFPYLEHDPILRTGWTDSPLASIILRGDEDVVNWLTSSTKLSHRTLERVRASIQKSREGTERSNN